MSGSMKAIMAVESGKLGLGELAIPVPGEFEALVKMEACAICNSTDHKLMTNEFFAGSFPVVLGHEVISTVVEVGPGVKNFKVGDRVFRQRLYDSHVPGGRSCWGGFAEYGVVTDEWAKQGLSYGPDSLPYDQQKLLIDVKPELAAGMVTLMECLDCATGCGAAAGKSVAVVGSGPVGQSLAMFSKLLGAGPVYAFGRNPGHSQRFAEVVRCDGYMCGDQMPAEVERVVANGGFDVVIEAVGAADALDKAVGLAGSVGSVFVYGIAPDSAPYRVDQMSRTNVSCVGATEGRAQGRLVEFVESGRVDLSDWVSHKLSMAEYQEAFDLVLGKKGTKVVITAP